MKNRLSCGIIATILTVLFSIQYLCRDTAIQEELNRSITNGVQNSLPVVTDNTKNLGRFRFSKKISLINRLADNNLCVIERIQYEELKNICGIDLTTKFSSTAEFDASVETTTDGLTPLNNKDSHFWCNPINMIPEHAASKSQISIGNRR